MANNTKALLLLLILGLLLRLAFIFLPGFKVDVDSWFAWAERLSSLGFANFYSSQIWTGYPPGFLYIIALLGVIKNLLHINDTFFFMILKLPAIFSDLMIGYLVYKIIPLNFKWRIIGVLLVIFNPAFIFNSSIFGQFDSLFSLTLLLCIYLLHQKKVISSAILWSISFLLKPQAILLIPVFLFFLIKNFSYKNILKFFLPVVLTTTIAFWPFFPKNPVGGPIKLFANLFDFYPYNSIFAYNFWGIFGFWISDTHMRYLGYILFVLFWIVVGFFYFRKKLSIFSLSTLAGLSFFFLLTRMHERYLFPSLVFLIILSVIKKSSLLILLTIILTLIHFLNLYYVYIFYNQFYLKLPSILFNDFIYNFAAKNVSLISSFSTFIFISISIHILKLDYDQKN